MTSSDRVALGCIAAILAVPLCAGGAVVAFLASRPPAPPAPAHAPTVVATPTIEPAASAPPAAPGPVIEPEPPPPIATVAPAASEAPAEEWTARPLWDAKVVRGAPGKVAPGTRCTIEATVASSDRRTLHLGSGLTVRCGAVRLLQVDAPPVDAKVDVAEVAGPGPGAAAYVLRYSDRHAIVDTPHASASLVLEAPPDATVMLVVAGESRPLPARLLDGTPAQPTFYAGAQPGGADDDETAGRVVVATGDTVVEVGTRCRIGFHYYGTVDGSDRCDALIVCGAATVIGRPERFAGNCKRQGSRVLSMQDLEPASIDRDPALDLDGARARAWNDVDGSRWSVTIALDPRR